MRGLSAAALPLVGLCLLVSACGGQRSASAHTCSATDRDFIQTAQLNVMSLNEWAVGYLDGSVKPLVVVKQARDAAKMVNGTTPSDPSLEKTKYLMNAMFNEYATAVLVKSEHKDPGRHIYRAYGLANFAHDVLAEAQPALGQRGCDVGSLL
ncbi:MAG: hypothetical protein ABI948_08605 [Thermoleophilia bacterium]